MKRCSDSLTLAVLVLSFLSCAIVPAAHAQVDHIVIAAGTDEDHALQAISNEQDAQKKIAMYEDFVQKFSSNPAAVAYGNWQLAQAYQSTGDLQRRSTTATRLWPGLRIIWTFLCRRPASRSRRRTTPS